MLFATAVLAALLIAIAATLIRRTMPPAWLLLALSGIWLPSNSTLEGPILVPLSRSHGVTLADLLSVVGAVVAGTVLIRCSWRQDDDEARTRNVITVLGACWSALALGALVAVTRAN
jgi:hypothetical protein